MVPFVMLDSVRQSDMEVPSPAIYSLIKVAPLLVRMMMPFVTPDCVGLSDDVVSSPAVDGCIKVASTSTP